MRDYFIYMMSNMHRTLYVGVTSDLFRRVYEHRNGVIPGFTNRYGLRMLVWYEQTGDILEALAREKEIKGWRREKKIALIKSINPEWKDLSWEWFGEEGIEERLAAIEKAYPSEKVIVLRELSKQQAETEILGLFSTGRTLYYSDIAEELRLDLELVVEICNELESRGEVQVVDDNILQAR